MPPFCHRRSAGLNEPRWGERTTRGGTQHRRAPGGRRQKRFPVIHVQHMSQEPESPLRPEKPATRSSPSGAAPRVSGLPKTVTARSSEHRSRATCVQARSTPSSVVGLTTDHCVSSTTRMAANLGFHGDRGLDGTATFDRTGPTATTTRPNRFTARAASLHGEFARVRRTDRCWRRSADPTIRGAA